MLPGLENAGIFSDGLLACIAGDLAECGVDVDNFSCEISDDDSFVGMGKSVGNKLQSSVFGLVSRDVGEKKKAPGLLPILLNGVRTEFDAAAVIEREFSY